MRRMRKRSKAEPVVSLINIVFLILIFFMVAGTLSGQSDGSITFVQTRGLECCVEPDAMSISREGALSYQGATLSSPADYLETQGGETVAARLMPDRDLPARQLLDVISQLQSAGAGQVIILTESSPE